MPPLLPRLDSPDDRLALSMGGERLTYRQLNEAVAGRASALFDAGVRPGDRVALVMHPDSETAVAVLAHLASSVVTVPLDPRLGRTELAHVLEDASPTRLLSTRSGALEARVAGLPVEIVSRREATDLPSRSVDRQPAFILYTSGTTGKPKGAIIDADQIASNLDGLASAWAWDEGDMVVHALPLFHVHGLVLGLLGSLRVGGALSLLSRFDPLAVADALRMQRSMLFAVPTMYHRLADAAEKDAAVAEGLRSARLLVSGSAGLPLREHRRIVRATGRGVHERYGLTETLINCAVPATRDPMPGFVGPPVPGVDVRLVDEGGAPIDAWDDRTLGEVVVRGPNVFSGYLNLDEATAAVLDEGGWFHTGDLATRAPDGSFRIHGRKATDLIKTGGYKVGAGEVETCLLEISGVREVAVVGVPDDDLGERIEAHVVPRDPHHPPKAEDLIREVADALAPHKRPRAIHFSRALPRNPMGKVQKAALRRGRDG